MNEHKPPKPPAESVGWSSCLLIVLFVIGCVLILVNLARVLWSLKDGQVDDLDGLALAILITGLAAYAISTKNTDDDEPDGSL